MSKPVNPWDLVLGIGYGIVMTLLLVRVEEVISQGVMLVGHVILVATVGMQTFRLSQTRKAEEAGSP